MAKTKLVRTKLVCGKCEQDWRANGSPAICPACNQASFGIAVSITKVKR